MKKGIYAFLFCCIAAFSVSCDGSDKDPFDAYPSEDYKTIDESITNSGCKSYYTRNVNELVQLETAGTNHLTVKHIDAMLNCEPGKISFDCQVGEGIITIREKEESTAANCVCPYDLTYKIALPKYGTYKLIINLYEFGEFEFSANTKVTLQKRLTPNS